MHFIYMFRIAVPTCHFGLLKKAFSDGVYAPSSALCAWKGTPFVVLEIEKWDNECMTIRMKRRAGVCATFLLISDVHLDSLHCDQVLLKRHLDEARKRGAYILIGGDLCDAMQGRNDRRGSKGAVRPELNRDDYFDALVEYVVAFLKPYADLIVMIGDGSHETAVLKHGEKDLTKAIARELGVTYMGYSAYVEFFFSVGKSDVWSIDMVYHHGSGGGGVITKGQIGNTRRSMAFDAGLFWTGHVHEHLHSKNVKAYLARTGDGRRKVKKRTENHIITPGYKEEFSMEGGFHIEKGRPPKPLGGMWLTFRETKGEMGYALEAAD